MGLPCWNDGPYQDGVLIIVAARDWPESRDGSDRVRALWVEGGMKSTLSAKGAQVSSDRIGEPNRRHPTPSAQNAGLPAAGLVEVVPVHADDAFNPFLIGRWLAVDAEEADALLPGQIVLQQDRTPANAKRRDPALNHRSSGLFEQVLDEKPTVAIQLVDLHLNGQIT